MKNIYNEEFEKLTHDKEAIIIDVRTKEEVNSGTIPGSQHIDMFSPTFMQEIQQLDKDKTYFVFCRSGNRSSSACGAMKSLGFNKLYNLIGGIGTWTGEIK